MKKKLSWRIWLLIFILFLSVMSIVNFEGLSEKGVLIKSVDQNSTAFEQGLRQGQIISSFDGNKIGTMEDYSKYVQEKFPSNEKVKTIITTTETEFILFSENPPEIAVSEIPKTNIKTGLDLAGGARALVQAQDHQLSSEEINDLVDVLSNRLNVYGIEDVKVIPALDLEGNNRIRIEIAGATPDDLEELISKQGKFEAKIGNETAFIGGERDISSVSRNPPEAIIENCNPSGNGYYCNFRFAIYLSEDAAQKHADITGALKINATNPEYLSEPLDLYLDGTKVDSLFIGKDLKGRVTTQISISGSGSGATQEEAYEEAQIQMHKLQTILITGSLPFKLEIVKLDTISPSLGNDFVKFILIAGLVALLSASLIVFIRYRNFKSSLMVILFSFSEIIVILGVASLIEWNLDLPSIAGILATIGTGFDDQIVILDESKNKIISSLKQRLKRAFTIIMGAYFTAFVSLLPLIWAGAGLLKGFAITTIIGISIGVFITRPAFSDVIERIEE
jgi:preprotein translocase subunit SecD